ncbi:LysR family transcriptional regulator [Diaphorobacter sp. HDW4B]|uniref:LysR family transcriptional regulator n=1 Tax=Diaphorobacter sp. HDW4B TaxID=2714925 RepID=UPI0014092BAA|nr:LysR family transcriptional regulator [Diaphorobacter sp. HDW4B]QIL71849.1 LysR family transcriptional regulator [Diaphorobacter sp. HDW4B]
MFATDSQHADELATLLALAEKGTFVAAGDLLQRHPSVLTKRLKSLENRLGVRLVERTTRRLHLTQEGERLVQRLREAQGMIAEAEAEASQGAVQVRGRLRVSIPAAMGRRVLAPMLAEFALAHPEVTLELEYADRMVDIVGERFDAAIRIGKLADSRLVATRLSEHQRILCAAPAYLKRCGKPKLPSDLAQHNCLGFTGFLSYPEWKLMREGECVVMPVHGSMISNDSETLLTAATLGVGIVAGGSWLFQPALAEGKLVRVLPEWQLNADSGIYFLRPSAQFSTAAMTAFRQWVVDWFAKQRSTAAPRIKR